MVHMSEKKEFYLDDLEVMEKEISKLELDKIN